MQAITRTLAKLAEKLYQNAKNATAVNLNPE